MLDMDGTIYYEDELIPGALDFFKLLKSQGKRYVFMTNNSSKSKTSYVEKLNHLGIDATEEDIASSVNATILFLKSLKNKGNIYLVGTESFKDELISEGFTVVPIDYRGKNVDFVVVGFDTELTYEKLVGACYYVSRDFQYLATNCDLRCPVKDQKFIPDCGSITNMIAAATGRNPVFLGKPDRAIVDYVAQHTGIPICDIACVGDRLYTDIAVGINAGATSICVLTGEATRDEIVHSEFKPDYCFDSIAGLLNALK